MRAAADPLQDVRLLLPVKRLSTAKSRLSSDAATRRATAEWLFRRTLDVATSLLAPHQVVVLTADEHVTRHSIRLGIEVLHDSGPDLNSALQAGMYALGQQHARARIVVLVADLPRLESDDLRAALLDAARSSVPRHVPDHHGTGTTLVSVPPGLRLPMVFGEDSALHFARLGSVPIEGAARGIRTDLDTPADPFQLRLVHTREAR
ncbi:MULTISPECIES: 2-phospho-L-lactate guanylyltransferase [unclassified Nocardioides]|uniref:2-phospho-L-lactate guanylyltransferase n=1 Tax=unclassified Nocardioides TaxID=2615069 RepID=UPI000056FD27|nr:MULTISPECIES: 2-phospho-L-lactate guanylyltransferase [unclassified Nocardioides]ABL80340.1 conserved hypothetical alanine rich protein [Nocardioides sp. JS614]